ncbi:hypothetical protein C8R43DRAFT_1132292 [Mycena crocata]|nr:hypothetical protein C8R43DRAFT_1132292 [Mycena crocata]
MANLTRLSLTVTRPENVIMPAYEHFWALFAMLGRCPDLRDLRLAFESRAPIDICALFGTMSWPKLQRLILEGDYQPVPATTLNPFLLRHPSLEILSLMIPHDQPLPTMPHLRWLSARRLTREAFSQSEFPGLEYLVTWRSYIPTLIPRLHNIPLLLSATVNTDRPAALELFAQSVPHLERLVFAGAPWNTYRLMFGDSESRLPSPECLKILAKFSSLTHLDSAAVIQEDGFHTGLPNILRNEAHSLRRTWYILTRDSLGTLVSWKETRDLRLVRFHDWEDSFRHIGLW